MERWKRAIALEPDWNSPKEKLAELVKYLVFVSDLVTGKDRVRSGTVLRHEKNRKKIFFTFFSIFPGRLSDDEWNNWPSRCRGKISPASSTTPTPRPARLINSSPSKLSWTEETPAWWRTGKSTPPPVTLPTLHGKNSPDQQLFHLQILSWTDSLQNALENSFRLIFLIDSTGESIPVVIYHMVSQSNFSGQVVLFRGPLSSHCWTPCNPVTFLCLFHSVLILWPFFLVLRAWSSVWAAPSPFPIPLFGSCDSCWTGRLENCRENFFSPFKIKFQNKFVFPANSTNSVE